jgi:hypothetical protein
MFLASRLARSAKVSTPVPLSVRYDSLLVQCCIAAVLYYGPIDAAVVTLGVLNGRAHSNSINRPSDVKNPESAVEAFCAKKGLNQDTFNVLRGGRQWELKFANAYN